MCYFTRETTSSSSLVKTVSAKLIAALLLCHCSVLAAWSDQVLSSNKTAMAGAPTLSGSASLNAAPAVQLLQAAERALNARQYDEAKQKYLLVLREVNRGYHDQRVLALSKLGLAEIALHLNEDTSSALQFLRSSSNLCTSAFGADSSEAGRVRFLEAETFFACGQLDKALASCRQALTLHTKLDPNSNAAGRCLALQGQIENASGLPKEALESYLKSLKILEAAPGQDMIDYANALYGCGLAKVGAGDEAGATATIEKAHGLLDTAVDLSATPNRKGLVHYQWTDGVPESRQIYDAIYPLKYMLVDNLRIAVTLVRSDKHLAAIVSLANCSKEPLAVAVGPVIVEKTSPGNRTKMFFCHPGLIDMPLEEECVSNLTWRKRWLCHIQKTHRTPGYLKSGALEADNFYGNNLFGTYASWDANLQNTPPIVTREQFYFEQERRSPNYNEVERFMARSTGGYSPALIEPGDARTGDVFFLRQRYDTARVRVMVGNAIVDFPFQAVALR